VPTGALMVAGLKERSPLGATLILASVSMGWYVNIANQHTFICPSVSAGADGAEAGAVDGLLPPPYPL